MNKIIDSQVVGYVYLSEDGKYSLQDNFNLPLPKRITENIVPGIDNDLYDKKRNNRLKLDLDSNDA
jgi:hypothetical protein